MPVVSGMSVCDVVAGRRVSHTGGGVVYTGNVVHAANDEVGAVRSPGKVVDL